MDKKILDVTCGSRSIWFDKQHHSAVYCDKRNEEHHVVTNNGGTKHIIVQPDVVCDFTELPFDDETFPLVVFDPPHIMNCPKSSLMYKQYGTLDDSWRVLIKKGFDECMRVLKPDGVLIFKWAEIRISTPDVIKVIGTTPLFGHRSGKKANTHWMCFMKQKEAQK